MEVRPRTVFVAGATGYLGRQLVSYAALELGSAR